MRQRECFTHAIACVAIVLACVGGQAATQQQTGPRSGGESATGGEAEGDHEEQLSDDEVAAMAGTIAGDGSDREIDSFGKAILEALRREPVANNGVRATHVNARYGDHPRNVFDIWMVDSKEPAPLVIFIHGGGFRRGDKSLLYDSQVLPSLLDAGISVAGVNYRFAHQSSEGILGSLKDTARFLQFIRFHARTYHIDKRRVACYGGSAGGVASLWLAFHDDLAAPDSPDPIAQESTRLTCAAAMATPSTLDILQWTDILGISRGEAIAAARSFGVKDEVELRSEWAKRLRAETDLGELMSGDDPPIFVYNNESGEVPRHIGHMAHHPNHARVLKARADGLGIEAVVFAPQIGVSDPSGENLTGFLRARLAPSAGN